MQNLGYPPFPENAMVPLAMMDDIGHVIDNVLALVADKPLMRNWAVAGETLRPCR